MRKRNVGEQTPYASSGVIEEIKTSPGEDEK